MSVHLLTLPDGLPIPVDDGLATHLTGMQLPEILLESTNGSLVNLADYRRRIVIYIYPLNGQPNVALPSGWDEIPGARGCTPQACDFSNHHQAIKALNTEVFGLSTQTSAYQSEFKNRLHLPYDLLSDDALKLKQSLSLPTFSVDGMTLYKRLTLVAENQQIKKVFYPVFPPNEHASQVIRWLENN